MRLNSTHSLIRRNNNRIELQNIALNHSVDIDYNNLRGFIENAQEIRILF